MKAERTYNTEHIKSVVKTMWSDIADDTFGPDMFDPDTTDECWVDMTVNGESVGLYNFKVVNDCTLEIHAHILREFRYKHAGESGRAILQWFLDEAPKNYIKLVTNIPALNRNVLKFALRNHFRLEGVNRQSCRRNGVVHDQYVLGITRAEVEDFLNG